MPDLLDETVALGARCHSATGQSTAIEILQILQRFWAENIIGDDDSWKPKYHFLT
jgi:hypothetical protein